VQIAAARLADFHPLCEGFAFSPPAPMAQAGLF